MPLDLRLKRLLIERCDQLGGDIVDNARFIVVQPGDSMTALEDQLGWSIFENVTDGSRFGDLEFSPSWEWGMEASMHGSASLDGFAHAAFGRD